MHIKTQLKTDAIKKKKYFGGFGSIKRLNLAKLLLLSSSVFVYVHIISMFTISYIFLFYLKKRYVIC
jgi:hypothetical protein